MAATLLAIRLSGQGRGNGWFDTGRSRQWSQGQNCRFFSRGCEREILDKTRSIFLNIIAIREEETLGKNMNIFIIVRV